MEGEKESDFELGKRLVSYPSPARLRHAQATLNKLERLLISSLWTLHSYEPRFRLFGTPHLPRLALTHNRSGLLQEALTMNLVILIYI